MSINNINNKNNKKNSKIFKFIIISDIDETYEYFYSSIDVNYIYSLDYIRTLYIYHIYHSDNMNILDKIKRMEYVYIKKCLRTIEEEQEVILHINEDINTDTIKHLVCGMDIHNMWIDTNDIELKKNCFKSYNPNINKSDDIYRFCISICDIPFSMDDYIVEVNDYYNIFNKLLDNRYIQLFIIYGFISNIFEKLMDISKMDHICFLTGSFIIDKIMMNKNKMKLVSFEKNNLNYFCDHN